MVISTFPDTPSLVFKYAELPGVFCSPFGKLPCIFEKKKKLSDWINKKNEWLVIVEFMTLKGPVRGKYFPERGPYIIPLWPTIFLSGSSLGIWTDVIKLLVGSSFRSCSLTSVCLVLQLYKKRELPSETGNDQAWIFAFLTSFMHSARIDYVKLSMAITNIRIFS